MFSGFCQKFPQATDEVKKFFCHFPSPWVLRMSGMGGYGQKCEKMPKSLLLSGQVCGICHVEARVKDVPRGKKHYISAD